MQKLLQKRCAHRNVPRSFVDWRRGCGLYQFPKVGCSVTHVGWHLLRRREPGMIDNWRTRLLQPLPALTRDETSLWKQACSDDKLFEGLACSKTFGSCGISTGMASISAFLFPSVIAPGSSVCDLTCITCGCNGCFLWEISLTDLETKWNIFGLEISLRAEYSALVTILATYAESVTKLKNCLNFSKALMTAANSAICSESSTTWMSDSHFCILGSFQVTTDLWEDPEPSVKTVTPLSGVLLSINFGTKLNVYLDNLWPGKWIEIFPQKAIKRELEALIVLEQMLQLFGIGQWHVDAWEITSGKRVEMSPASADKHSHQFLRSCCCLWLLVW